MENILYNTIDDGKLNNDVIKKVCNENCISLNDLKITVSKLLRKNKSGKYHDKLKEISNIIRSINCEDKKYNNFDNPAYIDIFNYILESKSDLDAFSYLDSLNKSFSYLSSSIRSYEKRFINERTPKEIKYIEKTIERYKLYKKNRKIEKYKIEKNKTTELEKNNYINLIITVFENYLKTESIKLDDYLKNYDLDYKQLKKYEKEITNNNRKLYDCVIQKKESEEKKFKNKLKKIIEDLIYQINENEKFTLVDYYKIANSSFEEILSYAYKIFPKEKIKCLKKFASYYINLEKIDIDEFLKNKFFVNINGNLIECDLNFKKNLIEGLENKNFIINESTLIYFAKLQLEKKVKKIRK